MFPIEVPKYVIDLMERARYDYRPRTTPGYSIAVHKRSVYCQVQTLQNEVKKLCEWADRNTPEGLAKSEVLYMPTETHHCDQFAVVTILDPVMKVIEKYIKK